MRTMNEHLNNDLCDGRNIDLVCVSCTACGVSHEPTETMWLIKWNRF